MKPESVKPKSCLAIWNGLTEKYLLADSGRVFLTEDRSVAEGVIEELKDDGADISRLSIMEYPL